jgi:hypothetical protein
MTVARAPHVKFIIHSPNSFQLGTCTCTCGNHCPHALSTLLNLLLSILLLFHRLSIACSHNSHLQLSLLWIILVNAPLALLDHPFPSILNSLCLKILPLRTLINLIPLIVHTHPHLLNLVRLVTPMSLSKLPKEVTGVRSSINPVEYDNTRLTRMSCRQQAQIPKLVTP